MLLSFRDLKSIGKRGCILHCNQCTLRDRFKIYTIVSAVSDCVVCVTDEHALLVPVRQPERADGVRGAAVRRAGPVASGTRRPSRPAQRPLRRGRRSSGKQQSINNPYKCHCH